MKNVLFASTALAALAIGGAASAQGITLFGDARLGLGYNINNDGSANGDEDVRAVSRVRFGVHMAGETDSGISFGASVRADNAVGGQGGALGQTAGNVFVSGDWGTLTFGDTAGADENWVGDTPGNLSLTGLGDLNETIYISNGGSFGSDTANNFASNPTARPTIRYDFELMGFGLSVSSNRDLNDVGVGAGYSGEFGGGTFNIGLGYYDYNEFTVLGEPGTATACYDGVVATLGTCDDLGFVGEDFLVPTVAEDATYPSGNQYTASIGGTYGDFGMGVVYNNADSDGDSFEILGIGGTFGFAEFMVGAYYKNILSAKGSLAGSDGKSTYGLTASYDLGGGAQVAGGIARTYGRDELFMDGDLISTDSDADTVADFGIKMSF